jgi:predicted metal-dependent phosphoesterase TrpH
VARVDLHAHSAASDGSQAPAALVAVAAAAGLETLALTDHDTMAGVPEALAAAGPALAVVPGIELSVRWQNGTFHLLGHFAEPAPPVIAERLEELGRARDARNTALLGRLRELGIVLDPADVAARAGRARPSRSHIADALVAAGHAANRGDAFARLIGSGAPCYVPLGILAPAEAVRLVKRAGGAATLAHPATLRLGDDALGSLLEELAVAGLDAVEAHRGDAGLELQGRLAALAARHGLLATGGSDYHGPELEAEGRRLGDTGVPGVADETQRALLARIG